MLRYLLTVLYLATTLYGHTQNVQDIKGSGYILTQQRETAYFNSIEVAGKISVYIVQGEFQPITVEADNNLFSCIKTIVRNQTLKIYIPDTINIVKFGSMNVLISMPSVNVLQARQFSYINAFPQMWDAQNIQLIANSESRIKLAVRCLSISIDAKTSSIIELKGSAENSNIQLKTAASLYARDFETQKTEIELTTGARAEIRVNKEIEYSLCANAKLIVRGNPQVMKSDIDPGSKIIYDK